MFQSQVINTKPWIDAVAAHQVGSVHRLNRQFVTLLPPQHRLYNMLLLAEVIQRLFEGCGAASWYMMMAYSRDCMYAALTGSWRDCRVDCTHIFGHTAVLPERLLTSPVQTPDWNQGHY
jgi:hypothetical protein